LKKGNFYLDLSARDAAGLIKAWLRALKEPVIPKYLRNDCLVAGKTAPAEKLTEIVNLKFPKENAAVLGHLVRILRKVVRNFKYTKTDVDTLAVHMSSVLFPPQPSPEELPKEIDFVANIIENLDIVGGRRRRHQESQDNVDGGPDGIEDGGGEPDDEGDNNG